MKFICTVLLTIFISVICAAQKNVPLTEEGFIPHWIVSGPFEQPLTGFGVPADKDVIGEKTIQPYWGKEESGALVSGEKTIWQPQSINSNGFLDLNNSLRWRNPGKQVEKIWYAITGYAAAYIESPAEQNAIIKYGSNSFGKIFLNGEEIHSISSARNAAVDQDEIKINLKKGRNILLVKVGNSNANHELAFFGVINWEWGFYLKLLNENRTALSNVQVVLPEKNENPEFDIISTFFFKKKDNLLQQRLDVQIISPFAEVQSGKLDFTLQDKKYSFNFEKIPFGISRHEFYIDELNADRNVSAVLMIDDKKNEKEINLEKQKHYEIHLMMLSHTDIGYTHPQPVVKEIHAFTLDDVVEMCEADPEFSWTIETLWQLEQYEESRSPEQFQKIIDLIKKGRIAVSPLYSNPFTGWVSEEEMIRSLDKAKEYQNKYGLKFNVAVYNDVPGQAWIVPQILNNAGVNFLAEGLNEFFNDYSLQKHLPKAFIWEGSDGSRVVTYRNEAYNEGKSVGLESRGNLAVQQRLWEKLNILKAAGDDYELVLLNSAYTDNSIIPKDQFKAMKEWNAEFEYPKFISSNVSKFAAEFVKKYKDSLQVLKGDWTSNWDVYYQGEPDLMKKQRWVQHNLLSAEKLSTLTWLIDNKKDPLDNYVQEAYRSLLNFSGHGSGLEYGYGSPEDNLITMEYRENYVHEAYLKTKELLRRSIYRIGKPEESFEGEGVLVFNTLSWKRDLPVEIQFPFESSPSYELIDLSTNQTIPSYREGVKQTFIAPDVPPFGYKKFRLQQSNEKQNADELIISSNSIENQFYKINFDEKIITGITDKKSGNELIDKSYSLGFNIPLIEKFQNEEKFSPIAFDDTELSVKDERPVKLSIIIKHKDDLFKEISYTLWNNIDRVDVENTIDLKKLKQTDKLEEYAVAFPFNINDAEIFPEIIGGFINPDTEKLGTTGDGFSIRQSAAISNNEQTISWTSLDARVIRLRENEERGKVLISSLVNNFPVDWNRYEENDKVLSFKYSFTNQSGKFNPAFTSSFGWELNTPAIVSKSWYRSEPAAKSYFEIDNKNVVLLTIKPGQEKNELEIRLMNSNPFEKQTAKLSSEFIAGSSVIVESILGQKKYELTAAGTSVDVELNPNQIITLKIVNTGNTVKN